MFEVTEKAGEMINQFLTDRKLEGAIRILVAGVG